MFGLDVEAILHYLSQYGGYFLFLVMFLEHLNVPGTPAGIIMPAVGMLISKGYMPFTNAIIISLIASVLGSITLYLIGYYFGYSLLDWLARRSERTKRTMEKLFAFSERNGNKSVLLVRFVPVARTLISLVAGVARLKIKGFVLYSTVGIFIWNLALITFGYFLGYRFF